MNDNGGLCKHSDCERLVGGHGAFGYCPKHYKRYNKYGDSSIVHKSGIKKVIGPCSVKGCEKLLLQKGLCRAHYMKWYRHGDPEFMMPPARGRTATTGSWQAMKIRCNNPNVDGYYRYGGRGITYDPKWETYEGFFEDMGERPEGTTLDRIDNNGNYNKNNCRWATPYEQMNNIRTNRHLTYKGKTMTLSQWAREYNMYPRTFAQRLNIGWDLEKALITPVRSMKAQTD